ncbi:MAG: HEAT repeat domain-containing protein [Arenicellales bacterium]|nr:HEAT repeat domain-containing protein [Arenicellales bacterium]
MADRIDRDMVISSLREVLDRDNSLSRCCAIRGLARLNASDAESHKLLIDALLDPDPDVRVDAAEALGQLKIKAAASPLLDNIEGDPEGDVRIAAIKALGKIRSDAAVDRLIRCVEESGYPELDQLLDDDGFSACWEVQRGALEALGRIGDDRATQPVIDLLKDEENEELQESGFQLLAHLNSEQAEKFLVELLKDGGRLARRRAAQAIATAPNIQTGSSGVSTDLLAALSEALVDSDASVRIYAARALKAANNPMMQVSLVLLLNDPEAEVRHEVASLLGDMRGSDIVNRLHELLQRAEPELKYQLVRVLSNIADPRSYETLHELLLSCDPIKDHHLMYETIGALGSIAKPGQERELLDILTNTDRHYTVRVQAAQALGRIYRNLSTNKDAGSDSHPEDVVNALIQSIDDGNERVSYAAIMALAEIQPRQAVETLVALLRSGTANSYRDPDSEDILQETESEAEAVEIPPAMQEMISGHDAGTSTLAAILTQPSSELEAPGPEPGTESSAASENVKRILAARLLGNISRPDAQAMAALIEAGTGRDATIRKEAILSLGRIAHPESAPVILDGLNAQQDEVRLASLDALAHFGDLETVNDRLAVLFSDPDPNIRERIAAMLDFSCGDKAQGCLQQALQDEDHTVCKTALARLTEELADEQVVSQTFALMFKFGGELRTQAAAALRRMNDLHSATRLIEMLNDEEQEVSHWICIDALAEMYTVAGSEATT